MAIADIDLLSQRLLAGAPCLQTVPDSVVATSGIDGLGLFSTRARAAGEVLCVLDGQVVEVTAYPGVTDALEWNALDPDHLLVRGLRTSYGYINHSARPNVAIDADGRTMRTCEAVMAGAEFTMDYLAQPVPAGYRDSPEGRRLR
ncbi:MAG TPA: SET domain-containing protein [Lysobacter sp.]